MKIKTENIIYPLSAILIISFLVFVFILVIKSFSGLSHTEPLTKDFIVSFTGAFFAFLFIRISDAFTKIYDRQVKNRNALVKIEYESNRLLDSLSQAIFMLDEFLQTIEDIKTSKKPVVYFNQIRHLPIDRSVLMELSNVDFINHMFGFITEVEKFNDSTDTLNGIYGQYKSSFIEQKMNPDWFMLSSVELEIRYKMFKNFAIKLTDETKEVISITRVLLKDKPFLSWLMEKMAKKNLTEKDRKMAKYEKGLLEKEIETGVLKSQERINLIKKS